MACGAGARALLLLCVVVCGVVSPACGSMYKGTEVVELNPKSFKSLLKSKQIWMVEFYAPWCGHCQKLKPDYIKAAEKAKGVVRFAAVDADQHRELGQRYGVKGFPTLKVFGVDKKAPQDYQGARSASAMLDHMLNLLPNNVLQVKDSSSKFFKGGAELPRMLLFSSKSTTSPLFKSLALEFKEEVVFGESHARKSSSSSSTALEQKYGVDSRPTLVVIPGADAEPHMYGEELSHKAIRGFIKGMLKGEGSSKSQEATSPQASDQASGGSSGTAKPTQQESKKGGAPSTRKGKVNEILSIVDFKSVCVDEPGFCVVGVNGDNQSEEMLNLLQPNAVKYSEDPFIFASADEDIYESVMQEHLRHAPLDDGLRVMIVNWKRAKVAYHRGELTVAALGATLDRVLGGDLPFTKFDKSDL